MDFGFGAFFRSDHYLSMGPEDVTAGLPGPTDAWTTLAGLARETSTIRLGTLMTSAWVPGGSSRSTRGTAFRFPTPGSASTGSRSSWRSSPACGPPRRASCSRTRGSTTS